MQVEVPTSWRPKPRCLMPCSHFPDELIDTQTTGAHHSGLGDIS